MKRLSLVAAVGILVLVPLETQAGWCRPIWGPPIWVEPVPISYVVPFAPISPSIWGGPAPRFNPATEPNVLPKGRPLPAGSENSSGASTPKTGESPKAALKEDRLPEDPIPVAPPKPAEKPPEKTRPPLIPPEGAFPKEGPDSTLKTEMSRIYDEYSIMPAPNFVMPAGGITEFKVGFFNHTDRDVLIEVQDQNVRLPAQQYVLLKLPNKFTWKEKGGEPRTSQVPANAVGLEIVLRK